MPWFWQGFPDMHLEQPKGTLPSGLSFANCPSQVPWWIWLGMQWESHWLRWHHRVNAMSTWAISIDHHCLSHAPSVDHNRSTGRRKEWGDKGLDVKVYGIEIGETRMQIYNSINNADIKHASKVTCSTTRHAYLYVTIHTHTHAGMLKANLTWLTGVRWLVRMSLKERCACSAFEEGGPRRWWEVLRDRRFQARIAQGTEAVLSGCPGACKLDSREGGK